MNMERVQQIIATGENMSIEFKECKTALNKDVYEIVCAFLNINNANKLVPPIYLTVERVVINGAAILYIYVPPSSRVHRVNNRIFDHNYPIISAFFSEIGRADELGSGVRNLFHYTKAYSRGA